MRAFNRGDNMDEASVVDKYEMNDGRLSIRRDRESLHLQQPQRPLLPRQMQAIMDRVLEKNASVKTIKKCLTRIPGFGKIYRLQLVLNNK